MKIDPLTKEERLKIRGMVESLPDHKHNDDVIRERVSLVGKVLGIPEPSENYTHYPVAENWEYYLKIHVLTDDYQRGALTFIDFLNKLDKIKRDYQIEKLIE